jgi:hypothetical protein
MYFVRIWCNGYTTYRDKRIVGDVYSRFRATLQPAVTKPAKICMAVKKMFLYAVVVQ